MSIQDYNFACVEAQESLDIYRANGDKSGEIDALLTLGQTLTDSSAPIEKVMNLFESALALSESLGDQWRQAYTLSHMGWRNNYQRSVSIFEKAVKLFKKVGDLESATENMLNLVMRHMINSNLQLAQKRLDEVVKISQNLNSKELKAEILHNSGCIALIRGDYEKANSNLLEAMAIAQELGHRTTFLWTYVRLGYVALREGNLVKAGSIFIETTNDFQKDQNAYGIVFTLEGMASLYITLGKANIAARLIGWANAAREKIEDTRPRLEQADVDKIISACIGKIGQAAFSEAYDQGQKMTLDEAVTYALNEAVDLALNTP
jgi:tetratricopeptide (TPR) repeat protein